MLLLIIGWHCAITIVGFDRRRGIAQVYRTFTEFRFRAPGMPSMVISGDRLNAKAINSLRRIKAGQTIIITDIKTAITGSKYRLQNPSPISITIN